MLTPPDISPQSWQRADGYVLTTDRSRLDLGLIHDFLARDAYWVKDMSRARLDRALAGSLPVAVLAPDGTMAGFGRVVTDYAVFAYLRDVFTLPAHRGKGLASWLALTIRDHRELAEVRTWMLATRDAQAVYARAGYAPLPHPDWYMAIRT